MGGVGCREVVCLDLLFEEVGGDLAEEGRVRGSGAADDDFGGLAVVPGCDGGDGIRGFGGGGQVCAQGMETL